MTDWIEVNRANWDERAAAHAASPDYAVDRFIADPAYLSSEIRFDLPRLGSIEGLRGVHLQCHIGTDTVSLARLGAQMTGLDFSAPALEQAAAWSEQAGTPVDWVQAEFYDTPSVLPAGEFDFVFTGLGALCWLPDIRRWAQVVAGLLKPGGRLFLREGHPILWSLQYDREDDLLVIDSAYFEQEQPFIDEDPGTYVETDATFTTSTAADWNHGLGEIVTACLDAGLQLTALEEHQSVPWLALPDTTMVRGDLGEYHLKDRPERLPLTYTLQAVKPA